MSAYHRERFGDLPMSKERAEILTRLIESRVPELTADELALVGAALAREVVTAKEANRLMRMVEAVEARVDETRRQSTAALEAAEAVIEKMLAGPARLHQWRPGEESPLFFR
jgi:hypothetical protein